MSIHVIFNQHEGGFFSNFNKVVTHLAHTEDVSRVTWNLKGQPYGAFAYECEELFSNLFEQYNTEKQISNTSIVTDFKYLNYTGKNTHDLYLGENTWRYNLNEVYKKYFHPTKILQDAINTVDSYFSKIEGVKVGILKRNQLLKCEQVSNCMPCVDSYLNMLKSIDSVNLCVLSIDNNTDLNLFKTTIDTKITYSTGIRRTNKDTDTEPHFTPSSIYDAINYFIDVYMLSKCNYLIHPVSNMATAALYFNPNLKSVYLQ